MNDIALLIKADVKFPVGLTVWPPLNGAGRSQGHWLPENMNGVLPRAEDVAVF